MSAKQRLIGIGILLLLGLYIASGTIGIVKRTNWRNDIEQRIQALELEAVPLVIDLDYRPPPPNDWRRDMALRNQRELREMRDDLQRQFDDDLEAVMRGL